MAANPADDREQQRQAATHLQNLVSQLSQGQWAEAARECSDLAQVAASVGQVNLQAQALNAQDVLWQVLAALERTASGESELRDPNQLRQLVERSDSIDELLANVQRSLQQMADTVAGLANSPILAGSPGDRVQLHCWRAQLLWANDDAETARAALETAAAIAREADRPDLLDTVRQQEQALEQGEIDVPKADAFSLLELGLRSGRLPIQDAGLQAAIAALQQDDWERVAELAGKARRQALKSRLSDRYLSYLYACFLGAVAQEQLGDRAGALERLIQCQKTLEQAGVESMGEQLKPLFAGLRTRWGEAEFQEVKQEFQRRMRARRSQRDEPAP